MVYFKDCKTIDEIKTAYKKLAKENHPDVGGDTATMQAINREYVFACASIAKGSGLSDEEANEEMQFSEKYRNVIEQIIHLPGIIVELVGGWIWVTGLTYPVKKELKTAGLFYAHKKVAWYFRSERFKTRGGKKSLDEIRNKYGTKPVKGGYGNNKIESN